jgi:hypothetical protein
MANLVLVQYIEQGPLWLAQLLQFVPSFNLYRGLYELSQVRSAAGRKIIHLCLSGPGH